MREIERKSEKENETERDRKAEIDTDRERGLRQKYRDIMGERDKVRMYV